MDLSQDQIRQLIAEECDAIKSLLLEKNASYGNSVFSPIGIFSHIDPDAGIRVRIDDKLKRIRDGKEYSGDDTIKDLIGYLLLLRIWTRMGALPKEKISENKQEESWKKPYKCG